jgi:hypothetical protein
MRCPHSRQKLRKPLVRDNCGDRFRRRTKKRAQGLEPAKE